MTISISYLIAPKSTKYRFENIIYLHFLLKMTPEKRNRNLTSQIYQSQIQQSTSSGSDPDQKVRNSRIFVFFSKKAKFTNFQSLKINFMARNFTWKRKRRRHEKFHSKNFLKFNHWCRNIVHDINIYVSAISWNIMVFEKGLLIKSKGYSQFWPSVKCGEKCQYITFLLCWPITTNYHSRGSLIF